jgi:transcriptional regulator with XRE-family HTH domain
MPKAKSRPKKRPPLALHRACEEAMVNLAELSRRTGIRRPHLSAMANGRMYPSELNLHKIADALGFTVAGLVAFKPAKEVSDA